MGRSQKSILVGKNPKKLRQVSKLSPETRRIVSSVVNNKTLLLLTLCPLTIAVIVSLLPWRDVMTSDTFQRTFCTHEASVSSEDSANVTSETSPVMQSTRWTAVLSGVNVSYYDWVPMTPAHIYDPVDDRQYPYRVLRTLRTSYVRLPDRDISPVELRVRHKTKSSVKAYLIDDLLSEDECDILMALHDKHIADMSTYAPIICFDSTTTLRFHLADLGRTMPIDTSTFTQGTRCLTEALSVQLRRWGLGWSHGTAFYPGESPFSRDLAQRIDDVTGLSDDSGGPFRVVSYQENTGYKKHTDCTAGGSRGKEDRFGTVLIYLNDVAIGGHTQFPELGISIKPKKGRALVFSSMTADGRCDFTSTHIAQPVIKGHKYILQRWYYYQNFPGIEKRPPVPPIPQRHSTQAYVSCDEYKNGSCRWYDAWTYDVLTHY